MSGLSKLLQSSTAWLGALVAGATHFTGGALPPWLAATIVGAYGLKEVGAKVAEAATTKYVNDQEQREHETRTRKGTRAPKVTQ